MYIHGKSIDVTGFSKKHPGGAKALHIYNRRDASEVFDAYHSPAARARMEKFGKSSPEAPVTFNKRTQEVRRCTAVRALSFDGLARTAHSARPPSWLSRLPTPLEAVLARQAHTDAPTSDLRHPPYPPSLAPK